MILRFKTLFLGLVSWKGVFLMIQIDDSKSLKKSKKKKAISIWNGFIDEGTVNILVAQQSRGKSQLALQLCKTLMLTKRNEKMLLDTPVTSKKMKVLYLSTEMTSQLLYDRFSEMGATRCKRTSECFIFSYTPEIKMDELRDVVDHVKPDLVIIDIFGGLLKANGYDINSYADMNDCAAQLRKMNTTFLLIHHMNKQGTANGSVGVLSAMDTRMEMLETYRELLPEGTMAIHQSIHVYGKSTTDRLVNVVFEYPMFEREYTDTADDEKELDKPLARLIQSVVNQWTENITDDDNSIKKEYPQEAHIVGTYQQVAASLGMIDKYQFSPKRMSNLLALNKDTLDTNHIFFETKRKSKAMLIDIWHDPTDKETTLFGRAALAIEDIE